MLHAVPGAAAARRLFGESEAVCAAIRWHTTGRAGMTRLEKILYLADMIEPNRDYPGVENLRRLAREDLDAAVGRRSGGPSPSWRNAGSCSIRIRSTPSPTSWNESIRLPRRGRKGTR